MMKNVKIIALGCIGALLSCSQGFRDQEIKADITTKAKDDINFAGVYFVVEKGVVTLTGTCPAVKSKGLVLQKLSSIHTIARVDDHLKIAPLLIDSNIILKQEVDSVLAAYPQVSAAVTGNFVTLRGRIEPVKVNTMLQSISKLSRKINVSALETDL